MPSITFTDFVPPAVSAAWLNSTDSLVWAVFNGKSTAGTAGTLLRSNGTNIVNTTATYPATTTANQLLYSSATNTISGLTSANNSVLVTNGSGVPSLSTTLPSGLIAPSLTANSLITDDAFLITGSSDATKKIKFEVDTNVTTATTNTLTAPSASGTLALTTNTSGTIAQIPTLTGTVASSALTIGASNLELDFRSATAGSGTITRVTGTPSSLVVPSTATLGTRNATQSRLAILAMNNSGTIELAVANLFNPGLARADLTETDLVTTTAISTACTFTGSIAVTTGILTLTTGLTGSLTLGMALSGTNVTQGTVVMSLLTGSLGANGSTYQTNQYTAAASTTITGVPGVAVYSTTARTSLPYRVIGYIESTQATAGTWATAPSTIQGSGGNALTSLSSLGYGQTWQNVTASRVSGTTYYNTTGRPIYVTVSSAGGTPTATGTFTVNGVVIQTMSVSGTSVTTVTLTGTIVPPGASYTNTIAFTSWFELR